MLRECVRGRNFKFSWSFFVTLSSSFFIVSTSKTNKKAVILVMPPQASDHGNMNDMRRSGSESDFSQVGDNVRSYRDYRVRKSSLIGYVHLKDFNDTAFFFLCDTQQLARNLANNENEVNYALFLLFLFLLFSQNDQLDACHRNTCSSYHGDRTHCAVGTDCPPGGVKFE